MSLIERPSTPPSVPSGASGVYGGLDTWSMTGASIDRYEAHSPREDEKFLYSHLTSPPSRLVASQKIQEAIAAIAAVKNIEMNIYEPLSILLTEMSKELFEVLNEEDQRRLKERNNTPAGEPGHMTFVDHHANAPTQFPQELLGKLTVRDKPDLFGAYNVPAECSSPILPHHRIEAVVEAKPATKSMAEAVTQAATYAYRHQQARPDHPALYCLVARPQGYRVIVSEPSGVVSSPSSVWDDLALLSAYIYSHYVPPSQHVLVDPTITWTRADDGKPPRWTIRCEGKTFTDGVFINVGDPWRRRSTVMKAKTQDGKKVISKDYFRHHLRRFKEEELLRHIHNDGKGDLPGFVRLFCAEEVPYGDGKLTCGTESLGENTLRTRVRLILWDCGVSLLQARSVNDLLMAIYDVLEVHRTLYLQRGILHRDMSFYNILMYPEWQTVVGREVMAEAPPLIDDILAEKLRPLDQRIARCLLIDADNSARVDQPDNRDPNTLEHRTGTPMFIARSVSVGAFFVSKNSVDGDSMPALQGRALDLYVAAYGRERYDKYPPESPDDSTLHGATPPTIRRVTEFSSKQAFRHRPEHDVESIFWTMLYAFLRVQPAGSKREKYASTAFTHLWQMLASHKIAENPIGDVRDNIFGTHRETWVAAFSPEMGDIGQMLYRVSLHVQSEYALWKGDLHSDHLHEAVQRIILQYLVDHEDNDVKLNPQYQRSTEPIPDDGPSGSTQTTRSQAARGSGSRRISRTASRNVGSRSKRATGRGSTCRQDSQNMPITARPSTASQDLSPASGPSKRQSETEEGTTRKRRKGLTGSRKGTQDDDA